MSLRALGSLGFPVRLLKGKDIAQGALLRKQGADEPVVLLVVPGGSAGLKAEALGEAGKRAVIDFVRRGGQYLGFCGGAGLALSHPGGLGLCPWVRGNYPRRMLHLLSGYVLADPCPHALTPAFDAGRTPSLPVWWPGRFANSGGDVDVLARCHGPDRDFWIADIALDTVPERIFEEWKTNYGMDLTADFLVDSELMVSGEVGRGRYVLSYSHLETPDAAEANAWLAHVLGKMTGTRVQERTVPSWQFLFKRRAPEPCVPKGLADVTARTRDLMDLAVEHRLFFARTPWLMGWKQGMPGGVCNNLVAACVAACSMEPGPGARAFWEEYEPEVREVADAFFDRAEGYLLAARLMETMQASMTGGMDRAALSHDLERLFGHPMLGGGLLGRLVALVEEYLYLCVLETGDGAGEGVPLLLE